MKLLKRLTLAAAMILCGSAVAMADLSDINIVAARDTITDPYLVYPESYEADVHKMMQGWYMQNYVVLDRSAESNSDVPVSEDELIRRLQDMPVVIEMPYNSLVRDYIRMYTERRRALVETMLGVSLYYMPIFEEALEAEGLPLELKYLPIIESALNPNAVSRAGAAGLWQFMPATAKGLGMEINSLVDQRRDPIESSRKAAKYLHELYDIYHDWSLAIAAYNCGSGNVNKALRLLGEDSRKDFWEVYPYLPKETRGYFPTFIAANYVMTYYPEHNISPAMARRPIITDTVTVTKRVHFNQISDVLGVSMEALRELNPQYRQNVVPGNIHPYTLILPSYQALAYIVSEDSIANHESYKYSGRSVVEPSTGTTKISDDGRYIITEKIQYYKVKKGDTFNKVAKKFGVTVESIKKANGNIKILRRNQTIRIVTTERTLRPVEDIQPVETTPEEVVDGALENDEAQDGSQPEEMILEDGQDMGVEDTPEEATIENVVIQVEQPLENIEPEPEPEPEPEVAPASKPEPATTYHKVKSGETLAKIAKKYRTTVEKIKRLNPNIDPNKIQIGQRIRVK